MSGEPCDPDPEVLQVDDYYLAPEIIEDYATRIRQALCQDRSKFDTGYTPEEIDRVLREFHNGGLRKVDGLLFGDYHSDFCQEMGGLDGLADELRAEKIVVRRGDKFLPVYDGLFGADLAFLAPTEIPVPEPIFPQETSEGRDVIHTDRGQLYGNRVQVAEQPELPDASSRDSSWSRLSDDLQSHSHRQNMVIMNNEYEYATGVQAAEENEAVEENEGAEENEFFEYSSGEDSDLDVEEEANEIAKDQFLKILASDSSRHTWGYSVQQIEQRLFEVTGRTLQSLVEQFLGKRKTAKFHRNGGSNKIIEMLHIQRLFHVRCGKYFPIYHGLHGTDLRLLDELFPGQGSASPPTSSRTPNNAPPEISTSRSTLDLTSLQNALPQQEVLTESNFIVPEDQSDSEESEYSKISEEEVYINSQNVVTRRFTPDPIRMAEKQRKEAEQKLIDDAEIAEFRRRRAELLNEGKRSSGDSDNECSDSSWENSLRVDRMRPLDHLSSSVKTSDHQRVETAPPVVEAPQKDTQKTQALSIQQNLAPNGDVEDAPENPPNDVHDSTLDESIECRDCQSGLYCPDRLNETNYDDLDETFPERTLSMSSDSSTEERPALRPQPFIFNPFGGRIPGQKPPTETVSQSSTPKEVTVSEESMKSQKKEETEEEKRARLAEEERLSAQFIANLDSQTLHYDRQWHKIDVQYEALDKKKRAQIARGEIPYQSSARATRTWYEGYDRLAQEHQIQEEQRSRQESQVVYHPHLVIRNRNLAANSSSRAPPQAHHTSQYEPRYVRDPRTYQNQNSLGHPSRHYQGDTPPEHHQRQQQRLMSSDPRSNWNSPSYPPYNAEYRPAPPNHGPRYSTRPPQVRNVAGYPGNRHQNYESGPGPSQPQFVRPPVPHQNPIWTSDPSSHQIYYPDPHHERQ